MVNHNLKKEEELQKFEQYRTFAKEKNISLITKETKKPKKPKESKEPKKYKVKGEDQYFTFIPAKRYKKN